MEKKAYYETEADRAAYLLFKRDKNNTTRAHYHNSMEIIFVRSGKERVGIGGEERVLTAGEIGVSDSGDVHRYEDVDGAEVYILVASDYHLRPFRTLYGKTFDKFLSRGAGTEEIFSFIESSLSRDVQRNILLTGGFVGYLLGLLAYYYPPARTRTERDETGVRVLSYLNEHCTEDIHLRDLASRFGYTPTYFSALLRRYTGVGLRDYVNCLRVEKAETMQDDKRTVTEIAGACGFESLNTYYRAVKKFGRKKS